MKICHLTSVHVPFDTRIFHRELKSLTAAGHETHLVARHDTDTTVEGIVIHAVRSHESMARRIISSPGEVLRRALAERYDIFHFHDPELIPVGVRLKRLGMTVIYDVHEDYPDYFRHKQAFHPLLRLPFSAAIAALERMTAGMFDAVVTVTPTIYERFRRLNRRTVMVRNFPGPDELPGNDGPAWKGREDAVAYVGSLTMDRGLREMIDAVGMIEERRTVRLLLAGDFGTPDVERRVRNLPAWCLVDFHGHTDRAGTGAMLGRAKAGMVLCHPRSNYLRAYPTKMFEYMAAGIPVIASDFPLWREIVEPAECGILVDPFDTRAIADAVLYLIEHPDEARRMGRSGRAAAEDRYNWNNEGRVLTGLYDELERELKKS